MFMALEEDESQLGNFTVYSDAVSGHAEMPFLSLPEDPSGHCRSELGTFQRLLRLQEERRRHVAHPPPSPPLSAVTNTSEPPTCGGAAKRKRKRLRRTPRNSEEVESQRMTHIAVERNRRRQMNDHLAALRSLMPASFVNRGDQASIIGGAVDFIKEIEQLLHSLLAEKWRRSVNAFPLLDFFETPQYTTYTSAPSTSGRVADVEATLVQSHVNVRVLTRRRTGQLLGVVAALEDLALTVLHLNVTSLDNSVLFSFSLKMEEKCALTSADQIAGAVHEIFSIIGSSEEVNV